MSIKREVEAGYLCKDVYWYIVAENESDELFGSLSIGLLNGGERYANVCGCGGMSDRLFVTESDKEDAFAILDEIVSIAKAWIEKGELPYDATERGS